MALPWEQYQEGQQSTPQVEEGPWSQFQEPNKDKIASIKSSMAQDQQNFNDQLKSAPMDVVKGVLESFGNAASFIPRAIVGTATGLTAAIDQKDPHAFADYFSKTMEELKIPENKVGEGLSNIISYPFEKLGEGSKATGESLQNFVQNVWKETGHVPTDAEDKLLAFSAASLETLGNALPFVLGMGKGKIGDQARTTIEELNKPDESVIFPKENRPSIQDRYEALPQEHKDIIDQFKANLEVPEEANKSVNAGNFRQGGAIDFSTLSPIKDDSQITNNASGESSASTEAINRLNTQNDQGIQIFKFDPFKGDITPLKTVDRVDQQASDKEAIIQLDPDGKVTILDNKTGLNNEPIGNRLKFEIDKQNKIQSSLGGTGKKGFGQGGALDLNFWNKSKEQVIKEIPEKANEVRKLFTERVKDWDATNKTDERAIMQGENMLSRLEPDKAKREVLYDAIDQGKQQDHPFVKAYRSLADNIFDIAKEHGVVTSYVDNYITHMYDFGKQSKSNAIKSLYRLADQSINRVGSGMSPKSSFAKQRVFSTLDDAAKQAGLTPLTKDPIEVFNIYASSMLKAVSNKKLISDLKQIKDPESGKAMIIKSPKNGAPRDYTYIDHPQFYGQLVHKSIAPAMDSMFSSYNPSIVAKTMHTISVIAKTGVFSLSGFHIKSLADVLVGGTRKSDTILSMKDLMRQWKEGGAGDVVDSLLKGGLEIGHSSIDLNPSVFRGIVDDSAKLLDKVVPGLSLAVKIPEKGINFLNDFLWKVVHPSFKLALASQEYARLLDKGMEPKKASELAATFTNDAFGGLNWRRLALDADTELGSKIANAAASKRGQAYMQIGLLAPDWTVATARSWLGAIRKGKDPEERMMYAKYLLQSAVAYAVIADSLNLYFSGHHFWENDDPTYVDMGDGRKMQLSKHFMEGIHWLTDPDKTALNKLGTIPSELADQAMNVEYLNPKGAPPIIKPQTEIEKLTGTVSPMQQKINATEARLKHFAKRFTPISGQVMASQPIESAISGILGVPIYGKNSEQLLQERINLMLEKSR